MTTSQRSVVQLPNASNVAATSIEVTPGITAREVAAEEIKAKIQFISLAIRTESRGFSIQKENYMLLTDIAVEHTLVSHQKEVRGTFLMHPFTNTQRDTFGKFEIVRDIREPGFKEVKRSAFVTFQQLAELYAKGVLKEFGFSIRMCPDQGKYPTANPVKKILPDSIRSGSPFDLAVHSVDVSKPASRELKTALLRTHVKLQG